MSNTRSGLRGVLAALLIIGALFATGVVKVGAPQDTTEATSKKRGRRNKARKRGRPDKLQSLAYLGEIPLTEETRHQSGVHRNEPGAWDGYLLANPTGGGRRHGRSIREATLWDAQGKKLHSWSTDLPSKRRPWAIARLDQDGYLYAIVNHTALIKLDWHSNVVWMVQGRFHHDFSIADDGSIVALAERKRIIEMPPGSGRGPGRAQIMEHGVVFIDPRGNPTGQVWMYDVVGDTPAFRRTLRRGLRGKGSAVIIDDDDEGGRGRRALDVFHANSVLALPRAVPGLGDVGDVLVSLRNMNTVVSFSLDTGRPTWMWGESELIRQHDATLTSDGQVVVFDNRKPADNSRAVIVDPVSSSVTRVIGGPGSEEPLRFFSLGRGLAQALPNGNIMVVASNEGRVLEVTEDDRVVWEFWSPWIGTDTRKPIRARRLEGKVQSAVAAIVGGERPAPFASPLAAKSVRLQVDGPAQTSGFSPMGQATPVPPSPQ